jgi:hypothetical protein
MVFSSREGGKDGGRSVRSLLHIKKDLLQMENEGSGKQDASTQEGTS